MSSLERRVAGKRQDIHLPRKVPVAWIYLTAWMTKDQTVQFRNDIYDQDGPLTALLASRRERLQAPQS